MILQIKQRARKKSSIILIILLIFAAFFILLNFKNLIVLIQGPKELTQSQMRNGWEYYGQYVAVKDISVCAEFATETKASPLKLTNNTYKYYLCRDNRVKDEYPVYFAIRIPEGELIKANIPVMSENTLSHAVSYSAAGTMTPMSQQALEYFKLVLNKLTDNSNNYDMMPYYIKDGYIGDTPVLYPVVSAAAALVLLLAAAIIFIRYKKMTYLTDIIHEIYENPEEKLNQLEEEFTNAQAYGGDVKVSKNYIFWKERKREKLIPLGMIQKVVLPDDDIKKAETKIKIILKDDKKYQIDVPAESVKEMYARLIPKHN